MFHLEQLQIEIALWQTEGVKIIWVVKEQEGENARGATEEKQWNGDGQKADGSQRVSLGKIALVVGNSPQPMLSPEFSKVQ